MEIRESELNARSWPNPAESRGAERVCSAPPFPTVVIGFENRSGLCFVNFSEMSKIDQQPRTQESILPQYRWSHFSLLGLSNEFSSKAR
jgi:hypothetical protein